MVKERIYANVSTEKLVYTPGEDVVVNFSNFPGTRDWISIALKGSADNTYVNYDYTQMKESGSLVFKNLPVGEYEVRGYYDLPKALKLRNPVGDPIRILPLGTTNYAVKARNTFRIGNTDTNTIVTTDKYQYSPGEIVTVNFSGFPGYEKDWIAIAKKESSDIEFLHSKFLNKKQSGSVSFEGYPEGEYEVRGYLNDQKVVKIRKLFRVGVVSIKTDKNVYQTDESITVNYYGFPVLKTFYLTMSAPDAANNSYLYSGSVAVREERGIVSLSALPAGNYEVRAFFDRSLSEIKARYSFTVAAAPKEIPNVYIAYTMTAKDKYVVIEFSGFPGNETDYICVAEFNSPPGKYLQKIYTGGKKSGRINFDMLPNGLYGVAGYFNDEPVIRASNAFGINR